MNRIVFPVWTSEPHTFLRPLVILSLILTLPMLLPGVSAQAQEGIIAASYYEEKTMLRKMWDAREAGDEKKVKSLSLELTAYVTEKKNWARDFLTLTQNSMAELQKAQTPDLTAQQRAEKELIIRDLKSQIRGLEQQLEEARLLYFQANYLDRLEIRKEEKLIKLIREAGGTRIAQHEKLIADNRPLIDGIKTRANQIIAEKNLLIAERQKLLPILVSEGEKFLKAEHDLIAERQAVIPRVEEEGRKALAEIDRQIQEMADRKSLVRIAGFKKLKELGVTISAIEQEISRLSQDKVDTSHIRNSLTETRKALRETEAQIADGTFSGPESNWISLNGIKQDIQKEETGKQEMLQNIANGSFSSPAVNWVTRQSLEKEITDHQKIIKDTEKSIADGQFSTPAVNWQTRSAIQRDIDQILLEIKAIQDGLTAGTFGCPEFNWRTEKSINAEIATWQQIIDETKQQIAARTFGSPETNWRTEASVDQQIAQLQDALRRRKEEFTTENYWNMGGIRRQIEALHLQLLTLEDECGLRDEKITALQAREQELKKYLAHDFLTSLPAEESGFIKAIRWCSQAIQEVNAAAGKFKKLKQVVEIVKTASNPAEAADRLLKATTGKGFFEFVGEKLLPEKVFNNPIVQTVLKGGKVDHQELVKKFAEDNLPPEMIETIKTFEAMKNDPQAFVRSKMYDEVMTVVEGNPKLKQTYQSFKEAEQFIKNPELIEKKLEESLKMYGQQALKNAGDKAMQTVMATEHAEKLKAQLNGYRERLERIQADGEASIDRFTENVAAGITRNLQNSLEETVGLKTTITPFVQELVEGYSFTD